MLYRIIIIFTSLFLLPNPLFSQEHCRSNAFELKGVVKKGNNKKLYLTYIRNNKVISDSIITINNKFIFKGYISCPTLAKITSEDAIQNSTSLNSNLIYLEPKKMGITLDYTNFKTLTIEGSKTQIEVDQFNEITKDISTKKDSISKLYETYYDKIEHTNDTLIREELQNKIYSLDKFGEYLDVKYTDLSLNFVKQNPSSFCALDLLKPKLVFRQVSYDTIYSLYNGLAEEVKKCESGKRFYLYLENYKKSIIGSLAPDFTVKDINDNPLTLSSFRNQKYILLDFWASYCAPCREEFPFLKEMYNNYYEKGFEVINISIDQNIESWKKAITKDGIEKWKHFSTKENNSSVKDLYSVTGIPVKILIDKNGLIIGRWRGGGEENMTDLKNKLIEIFNE